jgi:hypothetical protein
MSLSPRVVVRIAACTAVSPRSTVTAPFHPIGASDEPLRDRTQHPRRRRLRRSAAEGSGRTSNAALAKLAGKVQWLESFVVDDKTFCIYLAEDEAAVQEHSRISGIPATKVTRVRNVIDPMTAAA